MNWLQTLSARERQAVTGGVILLIATLLYLLAWEPLAERERQLTTRVEQQRIQLAWMTSAAAEAGALTPRGTPSGNNDGTSLLSLIDRSAADAGLGAAVKRLAPEGDRGVRIWLGNASYQATIRWLESLGRTGIHPLNVQMEHHETDGRIEARLLLGRAT